MGHLRKRGPKKYQIVIELEPDPDTGKRNFIYKTVNCRKSKAKEIMQDMEKELRDGTYVDTEMTFSEHLQEWFENKKEGLKPMTIESYEQQINNHILPELGKYKLEQLQKKPKILEDYYVDKLKNGRLNGEGGLSERTVEYHHTIIHAALKKAVIWNRLKTNPADGVEHPTSDPAKK